MYYLTKLNIYVEDAKGFAPLTYSAYLKSHIEYSIESFIEFCKLAKYSPKIIKVEIL